MKMKVPFELGVVGHFGLAVRDPKKSARWFQRVLGLGKEFEFGNGIAVGNDNVTIALFKGKPSPKTLDHMSFHLPNMSILRKALAHLKKHKVEIEDPGAANRALPGRSHHPDLRFRPCAFSNAPALSARSTYSAGGTTCDRAFSATVYL